MLYICSLYIYIYIYIFIYVYSDYCILIYIFSGYCNFSILVCLFESRQQIFMLMLIKLKLLC